MTRWLTGLALLCVCGSLLAEPMNIEVIRQQLLSYHNNGMYEQDIEKVTAEAHAYLTSVCEQPILEKRPAIVFDIDETVLSNFDDIKELRFGGTLDDIKKREILGRGRAIKPTRKLYQFARENGFAIFFITGRPEDERQATITNLKKEGFSHWHGLILRPIDGKHLSATAYKTEARAAIQARGYRIVATIGDQYSDIEGGHADRGFKLPNPFYFVP
jgi:acid phosphatase